MFGKESTPEQKERQRLLENRLWLDQNFDTVQKEFADQWVAVIDGKVAYNDKDVENVKSALVERRGEAVIIRIPSGAVQTPI
ncbi:MAG: hypothetical protein JRD71_01400 [Deltaproteobacteria bacterium]|nr:hypothetical protein [Deltaproteobacteria bacterium]